MPTGGRESTTCSRSASARTSHLNHLYATAAAMVAFAANSLLCRLALEQAHIDAASFSLVRVLAGTLTLAALVLPEYLRNTVTPSVIQYAQPHISLRSAVALSAYLVCFSFAYISLGAATGALILFGAVQFTMFCAALLGGERFSAIAWMGFGIAAAGVVYLLLPGVSAPDALGTVLMVSAGVAWGWYSLLGRGTKEPLLATGVNFLVATPIVACIALVSWGFVTDATPGASGPHANLTGLGLAIASGAIASGVGYAIWYAALRKLPTSVAAVVQLSVPVIAAIGAVLALSEPMTLRLCLASIAVLGGIALAIRQ